ncbi:cytochrome P450 [Echria macrotheca]|uniref:Cytochrome P450 n=1 Tax=Echria macrotheca TaxID=438768 RepID=A0AAJ0B8G4_9PEZI|nr:cytochrome P450 [Echria macrotheca]
MDTKLYLGASVLGTLASRPADGIFSPDAFKIFITLLSSFALIHAVYALWIYPNHVSPLRHLPGPKDHYPIAGQLLNQFLSGSPQEPFISWMKKWPDAELIRYYGPGHSDAVLVIGLGAWREIMSVHPDSFGKPTLWEKLVRPIVGKGLVFAEGEEHKAHRKLLSGPFSLTKLKRLIPVFQTKAKELSTYFDKQIETNEGVVELVSTFSSITLDIIGIAALGVNLQNLETPTPFHESYTHVFDPPPLGQALLALNAFVPIRWIPLAENLQFERANAEIHRLVLKIVRDRTAKVLAGKEEGGEAEKETQERRDLLTYIIEETYATENPWTEEEIVGHMLNMIAAGHETTASALQWAVSMLVKHPSIQTRLRAEIHGVLGPSRDTTTLGYSEIESLGYLNNFSIAAPRQAKTDITIANTLIPRGTTLTLMPSAVQLNPLIWGPDAETFNPDRWDVPSDRDVHAFAAFSQGPRQCIGRVFSMLEFKILIIEMAARFQFEQFGTEGDKIQLVNPSPLLRPKGGLRVRVSRI